MTQLLKLKTMSVDPKKLTKEVALTIKISSLP